MSDTEQRRYERLETSQKVNFTAFEQSGSVLLRGEAVAINMSKTGMLLQTGMSLASDVDVDIILNIDSVFVNLKCCVMYCRDAEDGTFDSGIHVRRINKKDIGVYLGFIEKLEKSSEKPKSLRPQMRGMTDVVKRISAEHKIINEYVAVLSEMMHTASPKADYSATILQLMKKDIITHFNIEENLFFKIGRSVIPDQCEEMISSLTGEHTEFLKTIDVLIDSLQPQIAKNGAVGLSGKEKICDFLELVKQHAVVELKDLFPLLEGNADAKKMILAKLMKLTKK